MEKLKIKVRESEGTQDLDSRLIPFSMEGTFTSIDEFKVTRLDDTVHSILVDAISADSFNLSNHITLNIWKSHH